MKALVTGGAGFIGFNVCAALLEAGDREGRPGDVAHSLADISAARAAFSFQPKIGIDQGLDVYMAGAAEEAARGNRMSDGKHDA